MLPCKGPTSAVRRPFSAILTRRKRSSCLGNVLMMRFGCVTRRSARGPSKAARVNAAFDAAERMPPGGDCNLTHAQRHRGHRSGAQGNRRRTVGGRYGAALSVPHRRPGAGGSPWPRRHVPYPATDRSAGQRSWRGLWPGAHWSCAVIGRRCGPASAHIWSDRCWQVAGSAVPTNRPASAAALQARACCVSLDSNIHPSTRGSVCPGKRGRVAG